MKIAVPAESRPGELRVAAVPDTVATLVKAGHVVTVAAGAGFGAWLSDDDYRKAGAQVSDGDVLAGAEVVLHVRPLVAGDAARLERGTVTIGFMSPAAELDGVRALRDAGTTSFSMELVPRISRAQSMDALTSQALVAGYRCALEAAMRLPRFFPLFMTAAGTVPPAKVLVLGAGVAGLQAIATARRLGAVVEAYYVRAASADEVRSMGATFVDLQLEVVEGAGGYAREQGEDRARRQAELLAPYVAKSDVLITTAAIPGRRAPLLVTGEMVRRMRAGSVVVDLAAETGGNCELSEPGAETAVNDVVVYGASNLASSLSTHASFLYARNIAEMLALLVSDGAFRPDFEDEIVSSTCVTCAGEIRHGATRALIEGGSS